MSPPTKSRIILIYIKIESIIAIKFKQELRKLIKTIGRTKKYHKYIEIISIFQFKLKYQTNITKTKEKKQT